MALGLLHARGAMLAIAFTSAIAALQWESVGHEQFVETASAPESAAATLSLNVTPGDECVDAGELVHVTLDVVGPLSPINGVQALLRHEPQFLTLVSIVPQEPWVEVIETNVTGDITYGVVILAGSTSANQTVATLTFMASAAGTTRVTFRPDSPPFFTKLTLPGGGTILPITTNSGNIHVGQPPCTITAAASLCPGSSENTASVGDAGSGAVYEWTITGGTITAGAGTNVVTYSAATAGVVTLGATVSTPDGCQAVCQRVVPIITTSITVNLELEAVGAPVTRDVTFLISDCVGPADVRTIPITTQATGHAAVNLPNVNMAADWISVNEGHTLARLAPLSFDSCGHAIVDMTSSDRLIAGDFHTPSVAQDGLVDIVDFSILATEWGTAIDPNSSQGADATGDGLQDTADFTAIQMNYFNVGDPANGCGQGGANALVPPMRVPALAASAVANIDLTWSPDLQVTPTGTIVSMGLIATPDAGADQPIAAMDVVLTWDPAMLTFLDIVDDGPYEWLTCGFLPDPIDGLNDSLTDGDAKYTALSQFADPAVAPPGGLLVTTFRFRAVGLTYETQLVIESSLGEHSHTVVYAADRPDHDVTGSLGLAAVRIGLSGDCDQDGHVEFDDFAGMQRCYTGPVGPIHPPAYPIGGAACCRVFDFDDDGDVDVRDVARYVATAEAQ